MVWSLVIISILGHFGVQSLSTTISKEVVIGSKNFQCTFVLKHTENKVNVRRSSLTCFPKGSTKQFSIIDLTSEKCNFFGKIQVNPSQIISMDVEAQNTTEIHSADNQSSGPEEIKRQLHKHACRTDEVEEKTNKKNKQNRSFSHMRPDQFWTDAIVPWSFPETSNIFSTVSVKSDPNIGLTWMDYMTVREAMRQIEDKTCIRFNLTKPVGGEPRLYISRQDRSSERFSGAWAGYGSDSPQTLVIGNVNLDNTVQDGIGLIIHELMHNLGVGHTQKRQDASEHIKILEDNIENTKTARSQYTPCFKEKDTRCSRYDDYGTPYNCMSIMHYRDWDFLSKEAVKNGGKTMIPRKEGCDLSTPNWDLTNEDVSILNKMYCVDKVDGIIKSPNYPENYLNDEDVPFHLEVDPGSRIKLTFTSFDLESAPDCGYDYVKVLDSDGTTELGKLCGSSLPSMIKSSGNKLTVVFYSDHSINKKGFLATWSKLAGASFETRYIALH